MSTLTPGPRRPTAGAQQRHTPTTAGSEIVSTMSPAATRATAQPAPAALRTPPGRTTVLDVVVPVSNERRSESSAPLHAHLESLTDQFRITIAGQR